LKLWVE